MRRQREEVLYQWRGYTVCPWGHALKVALTGSSQYSIPSGGQVLEWWTWGGPWPGVCLARRWRSGCVSLSGAEHHPVLVLLLLVRGTVNDLWV